MSLSTLGDVIEYTGGCHEYAGGCHEYAGGCHEYREDTMSTGRIP